MLSFENKKVLVFDLDGTIVKLPVNWKELKNILVKRFSNVYKEKCEFIHITACLNKIVEKDDEEELRNFFQIIEDYEISSIITNEKDIRIFETIFFIKNLNLFGVPKDIKIAVLSLNTREAIKKSLKSIGIFDKIDYVIGREDVRKWKPDPEGLYKIKEHFNVDENQMVYFGDLEKDVITGKNASIDAYLIEDIIALVNKKRKELNLQ